MGARLGALAMTGRAKYREGFGPYDGGVTHVPYGDLAAVERAMGPDVAGHHRRTGARRRGCHRGTARVSRAACAHRRRNGRALVARRGADRRRSHRVVPRLRARRRDARCHRARQRRSAAVSPCGAMLCREHLARRAAARLARVDLTAAMRSRPPAALAVLEVLDEEKLVEGAATKGEHLSRGLSSLAARHPDLVGPERGPGLLRALPLKGVEPRTVLVAPARSRCAPHHRRRHRRFDFARRSW